MDSIVVGFDGSPSAAAALRWAIGEAQLHHARLTVWTVVGRPFGAAHGAAAEPAPPPGLLKDVCGIDVRGMTDGLCAEHRVVYGGPAAELVRLSAHADLLVVGTRGRSTLRGLLLGSVSRACLHHSACPVVVIRPEPQQPAPPGGAVVVGVDASEDSRRAVTIAAEEARLRGAALHAIHTVCWDRIGYGFLAPTTHDLLRWGKRLLEAELHDLGVTARALVIHGHASDVLVRHSRHASLLVLGYRGNSPVPRPHLGSTSDHCARYSHSPLMIVR
jgi:nucleotide-binding universal stress UspA family protein